MATKMSNITHKWVPILLAYTKDYSAKLSASGISRKTGIPQQTVSRQMNELAKKGMVDYVVDGKNKLFYFDLRKNASKTIIAMVESHKSLEFSLEKKDIAVIINDFLSVCESVIVFGSYSLGTATKDSDLDVVLFGCKGNMDHIKKKYALEINEHKSTYKEFGKLLKNENALAIEIAGNHLFFGNVSALVEVLWV